MKLTFLGTGGAFTEYRVNYYNNAVVETDAGPVLIDCGGTAPQSMLELGIQPQDVAGVIITHTHGDHVGGLETLIWKRMYTGTMWLKTPVYAHPTILHQLEYMLKYPLDEYTARSGTTQRDGFQAMVAAHPVRRDFVIGGVRFTFSPTPHVVGEPDINKPCFGVLIERDGKQMYFTSDTIFRPEIGDLFPDAEILYHECTFSPKFPGTVHSHYSDLLTLPASVRARIVLMHHTVVPDGVDPVADGFMAAAKRHDSFSG